MFQLESPKGFQKAENNVRAQSFNIFDVNKKLLIPGQACMDVIMEKSKSI